MTTRVSPSETIRAEIDELIAGAERGSLLEHFEEVARAAVRLVFQTALEAEVTEFLGRDRYQRAALAGNARPGARNGYREVTVKTTAGPVALARPKLRGTRGAFASRLFGSHVTKTNALETLVIASFVRGLSVRDVEAALAEAPGPALVLILDLAADRRHRRLGDRGLVAQRLGQGGLHIADRQAADERGDHQ